MLMTQACAGAIQSSSNALRCRLDARREERGLGAGMAARGHVLIERPRLHALLAAAPVVVMQAPGGYGKSVAWTQLAAALDVPAVRVRLSDHVDPSGLLSALAAGCRRAGLPALAGSIDPDDPDGTLPTFVERLSAPGTGVLIGIDEVHRADP